MQDDRFDCATCMLALFARHVCMQRHRGVADRVTIEMGRARVAFGEQLLYGELQEGVHHQGGGEGVSKMP